MPATNQAVLMQINEAVNLRYDMEIRWGCKSVEARRLAMMTAEYITQTLNGSEQMRVLLHVAYGLEQRG
ncbi:hypothetical protein [Deinococcus gobiensis]|uniref:Uncharacterized protein n=1 Tax=Deinococcus gobiensis (strain DSM 21396 / JCM 16679 / CGMCC 1.7299 / I-0) TaxID=745776 RepID=H8H2V0_DEIGI|nr:hypothetical protein [Deinococcus gobiensis]AFD27847.1 hypothetical protein DGo_PC0055 [Deinococcus gobiensis I-0]